MTSVLIIYWLTLYGATSVTVEFPTPELCRQAEQAAQAHQAKAFCVKKK